MELQQSKPLWLGLSGKTREDECSEQINSNEVSSVKEAFKILLSCCWFSHRHVSSMSSTGAAVVAQPIPRDREVLGSNPAGRRAFFFPSLSYQRCILIQVHHVGATLLIFSNKNVLSQATKQA